MNIKELKALLDYEFPSKFIFYPWNCSQKIEFINKASKKLLSISLKEIEDDLIGNGNKFSMFTVNGKQQTYSTVQYLELVKYIEKELEIRAELNPFGIGCKG